MAGALSFPFKPSGRKQWTQSRAETTVRGLRSQLAEDGCADSQVVLAKELLESGGECDEENARLGVYWLMKASEQGNEEATNILKKCFSMGKGITELNFLDVKTCLSMSQDEKLARKAARKVFSRLSCGEDFITTHQLSEEIKRSKWLMESCRRKKWASSGRAGNEVTGSDGTSREQKYFQDGMGDTELFNGEIQNELEPHFDNDGQAGSSARGKDWTMRTDQPVEKLSEDHLLSAAVMYSRGELPLVHYVLDMERAQSASPIFFNPWTSLRRFYRTVIGVLGSREQTFLRRPMSSVIQILVVLLLYSIFEAVDWYSVLPVAVFHASFMAMIICTCQMLQQRHEFHQFRDWSGLFLRYSGGSLNPEEAEYQFCQNNLRPYGHFFVALLLNLMMYPLLAPHWTPHSEFTVLASILTFVSLYAFLKSVPPRIVAPSSNDSFIIPRKQPDILVLFSLAVNILAKYPYDLDSVVTQGWRYIDVRIPTFASYVVGHGIEFCLNFRAVFYLLMPAVFLKMAARDKWRGTYRTLIPHCVTLAWWQVAVLTARGSTWYGLIRATLAMAGLILFLPLAGLATVLLPLAAAARYATLDPQREALKVISTTALAATPLLVALWLAGRHSSPSTRRAKIAKFAIFTQVLLAAIAGILLILPAIQNFGGDDISFHSPHMTVSEGNVMSEIVHKTRRSVPVLTWEKYESLCHHRAWEQSSVAHVQMLCLQLEGVPVKWEGFVSNVRVLRVRNPWKEITRKLPRIVESLVACAIAGRSEEQNIDDHCNFPDLSDDDRKNCQLVKQLASEHGICSLSSWDRYDFEVTVKMKSGIWGASSMEVVLHADNHFRNLTQALRSGDHIWFGGQLANIDSTESIIGGMKPAVQIDEVGCHSCHLKPQTITKEQDPEFTPTLVLRYAYVGIKFVLNCLLNPIVFFK